YAYEWLTDFRDDDPVMTGGPYPRHILRKRKGSFVWTQRYKRDGVEKDGVRIITLKPPSAWHNEAINEEKESSIDYRLTPAGKNRTKLTISAKVTYKTIDPEVKSQLERNLSTEWDKFKTALEKDYSSGRAATA
ncbi:MAG: hypothetical protein ABSG45_04960, partial [Nitrososphaerales archaeon]